MTTETKWIRRLSKSYRGRRGRGRSWFTALFAVQFIAGFLLVAPAPAKATEYANLWVFQWTGWRHCATELVSDSGNGDIGYNIRVDGPCTDTDCSNQVASSTCRSRWSTADPDYWVKSTRKGRGSGALPGPMGHLCLCDSNNHNCLKVNHNMSNLRPYGVKFTKIKWGDNCGSLSTKLEVGYLYGYKQSKCLQKQRTGFDNGIDIHVWGNCSNDGTQENRVWFWNPDSGYIHNAENSAYCVHKASDGFTAGDNIAMYRCDTGPAANKEWDYSTSTHQFTARHNKGFCIDHSGNDNGSQIHLWSCSPNDGNSNNQWKITWAPNGN